MERRPFVRGLLAVALLFPSTRLALAQLPPLDHFKGYQASGPPGLANVTLIDQFHTEVVNLGLLNLFMPPVSKDGVPIIDPVTHFACYPITPAPLECRLVGTSDQFGPRQLQVNEARELCVPTEKNPGPVPTSLPRDHFKCYTASGPPVNQAHTLVDQFETEHVQVLQPVLFCNPVEKRHGCVRVPIRSPLEHLTCYAITPPGAPPGARPFRNQFGTGTVNIQPSVMLCVPSKKLQVGPCS